MGSPTSKCGHSQEPPLPQLCLGLFKAGRGVPRARRSVRWGISRCWGPKPLPGWPGCFTLEVTPLLLDETPTLVSVTEVRHPYKSNISEKGIAKTLQEMLAHCWHRAAGTEQAGLAGEGSGSPTQLARHRKEGVGTVGHRKRPLGAG